MKRKFWVSVIMSCFVLTAVRAEEGQSGSFGKWHISVGGAFNGNVDARLGVRNAPLPAVLPRPATAVPRGRSAAQERADEHVYDGNNSIDGFIKPDSENDGVLTTNWQLPAGDYEGDGKFALHNRYSEVLRGEQDVQLGGDSSRDATQFGVSVEIARELWIHDEEDDHRWGVDFAAACSYFFQRDIYRTTGRMTRTDTLWEGDFETSVEDADATFFYDQEWITPNEGMMGYGNYDVMAGGPALKFSGIGPTTETRKDTSYSLASGFSASGDYRELEMLFMLRPWYEITDWWRIYAEVGVGVSWGRFDSRFSGGGVAASEEFTQWDCYGVAGLGTAFRYDDWTLGIDFLGRFLRDDLEIDGKYVSGAIDRSDWGFRVMVGYEF